MTTRTIPTEPVVLRLTIHGLAVAMLCLIVWGVGVIWPIPHLGFLYSVPDGVIRAVSSGGPAAQAGLQVGDQVVALYDQPWEAILASWNVLPLIGPLDQPVPVTIQRDGLVRRVGVRVGPPDPATQAVKGSYTVLALCCWLTGYLLGTRQRQAVPGAFGLALFWLVASGLVGVYGFAINAALPLRLALHAFLAIVLMPALVAIHSWYPRQVVPAPTARQTRRWWLATTGALLLLYILFLFSGNRSAVFFADLRGTPLALLGGCLGSGMVLVRRYRQTTIPHTRRQIRLIAAACGAMVVIWLYAFFGPTVTDAFTFLVDPLITLAPALLPLAYLLGGVVPDLYRLDRLARRTVAHLLTLLVFSGALVVVQRSLAVTPTIFWIWAGISVLLLYRPLHEISLRLIAPDVRLATAYHPLDTAIATLATSLERDTLLTACVQGLRTTFGHPALACYDRETPETTALARVKQDHLPTIPDCLPAGMLIDVCQAHRQLLSTVVLHQQLAQASLTEAEQHLLGQPGITLWCPICHADGAVIGLILLGSRGDGEPYRAADLHKIQQLLDAAGLALTNSAAYAQQYRDRVRIGQLYRHMQEIQDRTAADVVREIHDEIINIPVRLNSTALERMLETLDDSPLRDDLALVLEGEQTIAQALRLICDQINPKGLDDPYALGSVLRRQVERTKALWDGTCQWHVQHASSPIPATIQREALRITREAMMNAIKHARATVITVTLTYPREPTDPLTLVISDNGHGKPPFVAKPGHWGLRTITDGAEYVGGTLVVEANPAGGTIVRFTCPRTTAWQDTPHEGDYDDHIFR
jgi:signal transduction histidine kinase